MELIHQSKSISATVPMMCVQFGGGKLPGARNLSACQLGSSWHFFQWQRKAKQIPAFHLSEVALSARNPINAVAKIACSWEKILEFCKTEQMRVKSLLFNLESE
jgi:hypothetical protein